MSHIIHFYDGATITITDDQADAINRGIDGGADWIKFGGDRYKVSDIRRIVKSYHHDVKDFRSLGLPELSIPENLKDAYAKRTISIDETKRLT